eukprot:6179634-Pleurochrysis_carterae.AAC.2
MASVSIVPTPNSLHPRVRAAHTAHAYHAYHSYHSPPLSTFGYLLHLEGERKRSTARAWKWRGICLETAWYWHGLCADIARKSHGRDVEVVWKCLARWLPTQVHAREQCMQLRNDLRSVRAARRARDK